MLMVSIPEEVGSVSPFISPALPTKIPGEKKKKQMQLFLCHSSTKVK